MSEAQNEGFHSDNASDCSLEKKKMVKQKVSHITAEPSLPWSQGLDISLLLPVICLTFTVVSKLLPLPEGNTEGPGTASSTWDSPGKNAGVGCHALLQGLKLL